MPNFLRYVLNPSPLSLIAPPILLLSYKANERMVVISDQGGFIPDRDEWEALRKLIDRFYDSTSTADIEAQNATVGRHRFEESEPRSKAGTVYLLRSEEGRFKIGRTGNLENRLKSIRTSSGSRFELVHSFRSHDSHAAEALLHERYASCRSHHEWFNLTSENVAEISAAEDFSL